MTNARLTYVSAFKHDNLRFEIKIDCAILHDNDNDSEIFGEDEDDV